MSNITITPNELDTPILQDAEFRDDVVVFTGGATLKPGTILARDSVSLKLVPFVKGGTTNGNGVPKSILTYSVAAEAAGDVSVRAAVCGKYRKERLVIAADGNASNVDAAVIDQLRDYSLTPIDVRELNILDNS